MRFSLASTALLLAGTARAATWTFSDASVSISSKADAGSKSSFSAKDPLAAPLRWGKDESLKVALTVKDGNKAERPHQAFVVLSERGTGLEAAFPITVKETGKGVAEIPYKKIPKQLRLSKTPLDASIMLGSFGASQASITPAVFDVKFDGDNEAITASLTPQPRYGKLEEIHHIFRADPKSPPAFISVFFALAVFATIPAVVIGWITLGANVDHAQKALSSAPISHAVFFGSLIAMEGVFFLYYSGWRLLSTLPVIISVGVVAFLSGNNALRQVQQARLAGDR